MMEEFHCPTCTIGFWKMVTCHLPETNCTSGVGKFVLDVKELFDKPLEVKKKRSRKRGLQANLC
jgi:hypothetical protein